jgi:hypothetical protein
MEPIKMHGCSTLEEMLLYSFSLLTRTIIPEGVFLNVIRTKILTFAPCYSRSTPPPADLKPHYGFHRLEIFSTAAKSRWGLI